MSEEIQGASVNVPRAIIGSIAINGALGFGMLLAVLFTLGDVKAVLGTDYIYPFIQIFLQSNNSSGGTTAMTAVILALTFLSTIGLVATSSRMTWSFARDRGLPGWRYLSKVSWSTRCLQTVSDLKELTFDFDQFQNFHTSRCNPCDNIHFRPLGPDRTWICYRLEHPHFSCYQQFLRLLPYIGGATPLAPLQWACESSWRCPESTAEHRGFPGAGVGAMEGSGVSGSRQQCLCMHLDGDNTVLQQLAQDNPHNRLDYEL